MNSDDREQLKLHLKEYVESITTKSKHGSYICPLCGSGTGKHESGAFNIDKDGIRWTCFACNTGGDLLDLIKYHEGINDHGQQLARARQLYGLAIDDPGDNRQYTRPAPQHRPQGTNTPAMRQQGTPGDNTPAIDDYTDFFLQANRNLGETTYHRGISLETLNRFLVGYVAEWRHPSPNSKNAPATPRLIIPTSNESYLARDTRDYIPDDQRQFSKMKVGSIHLFNASSLTTAKKPIFVVEGELDALSILDVGGEAVALGTVHKVKRLLELVAETTPAQPLILALDNDKPGQNASEELAEGLDALNIAFYRFNPAGIHKDANEALQANRDAFTAEVQRGEFLREEQAQKKREEYQLKNSTANYINGFFDGIETSKPSISTGFPALDDALEGGFYEGLYIIGAISSLGKTTFLTQIADQIAEAGQDVLIFSLEMSRAELIAKSISRNTIKLAIDGGDVRDAKTTRGITDGKRYSNYSPAEIDLIHRAIETYRQTTDHHYILEGMGDVGAEEVRKAVERHVHITGRTPVVIIDYLQILAPYDMRASDKQNTDKAVLELKRLSRDLKTPVVAISSFNRANYSTEVTMSAFKESGAIEYSSDVLIGLQLEGAGEDDFNATEAKQADPRRVELVVLKNRNGSTGNKIEYNYYPRFNYFSEGK